MTGTHAAKTAGKIVINGSISFAAILAAFQWIGSHGVDYLDVRYARATELNEYRSVMQLQHTRDSLIYDARTGRVEAKLDMLLADCRRRGGCQ